MTDSVRLPILTPNGSSQGSLSISRLPTAPGPADSLLDLTESPDRDPAMEPVQILEGQEYRYQWVIDTTQKISTNKDDVFEADTTDGKSGRLRPGLHTGWLSVTVYVANHEYGSISLEVRSRKLDYLKHYRWMLRDIAHQFAELVMERFAATEQRFVLSGVAEASTLYQRYAFLRSLLSTETFRASLHQVLARPYVAWVEEFNERPIGRGLKPSSQLVRQFVAPGPRVTSERPLAALASLPATVAVARTEASVDNPPNRFVKFALTQWRDLVARVVEALRRERLSEPVRRGLRDSEATLDELDALLAEELFREVGELTHFPADSQVLQKREGYRDLFRAYVQFDVAAKLSWKALEDGYRAGQRDVAALYEYWTFIQLANTIAGFCGKTFDLGKLLEPTTLGIVLREGRLTVISGTTEYAGRRLLLDLSYNRTFGTSKTLESSWSRPMRPDCSLRIAPDSDKDSTFVPVWLHFDAKYRVESIEELFGARAGNEREVERLEEEERLVEEVEAADKKGQVKRSDLLKMHAYRDAIKRSAGAYVLYPGARDELREEYHEILPGLGAFVLRPAADEDDVPDGVQTLKRFLADVLSHVASQATQHERGRFWVKAAYSEKAAAEEKVRKWAPFLALPAADTWVTLGYVTNPEALAWIEQRSLFPVCVDSSGSQHFDPRLLTAHLVLLYGPAIPASKIYWVREEPELFSSTRLREAGYPQIAGQFFYCIRLESIKEAGWADKPSHGAVLDAIRRKHPSVPFGSTVAVTWLDLIV